MKVVKFKYIPEETQRKFHTSQTLITLFGGAVGGGKTAAICAEAIAFSTQYNCDIIMGRAQYTDFRLTTEMELEKLLPECLYTKWQKNFHIIQMRPNPNAINAKDRLIWHEADKKYHLYKGRTKPSQLIITGLSIPENLKSFTVGAVLIDEMSGVPKESYNMLISRLREPSMHYSEYKLKAASNPVGNWVKELFIKTPKTPEEVGCKITPDPYNLTKERPCMLCKKPCLQGKNIQFIPSYIKDNPYLPLNYEATLYSQYPKELARMLIEGDWDALGGAVFEEMATLKYTDRFEIPPDWVRYMAIDPHARTPTHILWVAVSPVNKIYVYRELVISDNVKNICRVIKAKEQGEHVFFRIIDTSANSDDSLTGINIMEEFAKNGIVCAGAAKGNHVGYNAIKEAFDKKQIHIFNTCPIFRDQMINLTWDNHASKLTSMRKGLPQMWKKVDDHLFDCFKYIMITNPRYIPLNQWSFEKLNVTSTLESLTRNVDI